MTDPSDANRASVLTWLIPRLRCPDCRIRDLQADAGTLTCGHCRTQFPVVGGRPVLMRSDNELFPPHAYLKPGFRARSARSSTLARFAPSRSVNLTYRRNLRELADTLQGEQTPSVLVIGAGGQRRWLDTFLSGGDAIRIVYSDVDISGDVDLFCDAHELPFADEVFDGIVVCAVLEHVAYPERVAAEMHRVLTTRGIVYSEVPFLQQVHEGAYDFTRYTLSGHRRLLNHFEELSSGVVAGPGTVLAWAIEHFAVCVTPAPLRSATRLVVRTTLFWLKYFDYVLGQSPAAVDGASCTYFLGRKSKSLKPTSDIVARYDGVRTLRHV